MSTAVQSAIRDLDHLKQCLIEFEESRLNTLQELKELLAEAKKEEARKCHGRNKQIACVSGSSAAIVGAILVSVGFGLSFVTFGSSLIVSAVGAGIGGAGGLTVAGAKGTSFFLNRKRYKEVQAVIDKDKKTTEEISAAIINSLSSLEKIVKTGTWKDFLKQASNHPVLNGVTATKFLGKDILYESITTAKKVKTFSGIARSVASGVDAAADATGSVFKSLSTAGRVFHIGGFAFSAVVLPLDIYTLVTESIKIHKGTNDVEKDIEDWMKKLEIPEDFVDRCLGEFLLAVDGIE